MEKMRDEMHEKFEPVYQEIVRGYRLAQQENMTQYFEKSVRYIPSTPQNSNRKGTTSSGIAGYGIGLITGATIPLFEQCISAGFDKSLPYFDLWQRTLPYPALLNILGKGAEAVFQIRTNDDGSLTIINYVGEDTQLVIPASIGGKAVTVIGENAFEKKQLTSVVIPGSVKYIGTAAFSENQLTSVVIPGSVTTIGNAAFYGNQLTSVVIPGSVTNIENDTFLRNRLTSVTIGNGATSIGERVFAYNQLTSVEIPGSVTIIKDSAFAGNQLTEVVIPDSVTTIEKNAFSGQNIFTITIGANVNLGEKAWDSEFDSYYNNHGKKAGKYVPQDLDFGRWTRHEAVWQGKGKQKKGTGNRWMAIVALLGLVPLIGGFVVGHWFIGILAGIAASFVGVFEFAARGWCVLALALIGGSIALGIQVGHPVIAGIIGVIAGLVVSVKGAA
jgi:hypothetical protein